jgi:hypothetical protein
MKCSRGAVTYWTRTSHGDMIQVTVVRRWAGAGEARKSAVAVDRLWEIGSRPVEVSGCTDTGSTVAAALKGDAHNGGA